MKVQVYVRIKGDPRLASGPAQANTPQSRTAGDEDAEASLREMLQFDLGPGVAADAATFAKGKTKAESRYRASMTVSTRFQDQC